MKRDDLLSFGGGGNKVRKIQAIAAEARSKDADTLITCGGVQSNHARVTAAAGAALGMRVVLVLNGAPPETPTANTRLDRLFGAEIRYVATREERAPAMERAAEECRAAGQRPVIVPLGASTPLGALGFARGVVELATSSLRPDVIVHSTSSGGTQAGLLAGCALLGLPSRCWASARTIRPANCRPSSAACWQASPIASARGPRMSAPVATSRSMIRRLGRATAGRRRLRRKRSRSSRGGKGSCSIPSTLPRPWPGCSVGFGRARLAQIAPCSSGTPVGR